jgi:hypothetical protein
MTAKVPLGTPALAPDVINARAAAVTGNDAASDLVWK